MVKSNKNETKSLPKPLLVVQMHKFIFLMYSQQSMEQHFIKMFIEYRGYHRRGYYIFKTPMSNNLGLDW